MLLYHAPNKFYHFLNHIFQEKIYSKIEMVLLKPKVDIDSELMVSDEP